MKFSILSFVVIGFFLGHTAEANTNSSPRLPYLSGAHVTRSIKTRPDETGHIDSTLFPIRVHYAENVSLDYANDILHIAEVSWQKLFLTAGFLAPLPDGVEGGDAKTDLYIITNLQPGIGGYTSFTGFNEETPRADAVGYIVYAHDLAPLYRRGVIAHELFHLSQMSYDWWEDLSFMESSSVWASDFVFPDENIYWKYFVYYNREPYHSLDYVSLANPYQYGSAMWLMYLEERFGNNDGSLLRRIWENSEQTDYENVPNYLMATEKILQEKQSTVNRSFREFGAWRAFVGSRDDGQHFKKSKQWDKTIEPYFEALGFPGITKLSGSSNFGLEPMSHAFLTFPRNIKEKGSYTFSFTGSTDRVYGIDAYAFDGKTWKQVYVSPYDVANTQINFTITNTGGLNELMMIVTDLGNGHYDPNGASWDKRPFSYTFTATTE